MSVRSVKYSGKGSVEIIEVECAEPEPGQVQIEGLACGVCQWDLHVYRNGFDDPVPAGHEGIGRVVKLGTGVTKLKEGDWVTGGGLGFAERLQSTGGELVRSAEIRGVPEKWIVEPVACIVTGLDHCKIKAGDRIAVVGCGFMGQMFVQALSHSLLDRLIAIDVDASRLELAKKHGAMEIFDAKSVEVEKLRELKIDTVVDASGAQAGLDLSSKIVRNGGRLNLFGWNHGAAAFSGDIWHMNGLTVVNSAPNSAIRDPWPAAIRLLDRGLIDLAPLVSHIVPLDQYPALLAKATTPNSGYMKGVVQLSAS